MDFGKLMSRGTALIKHVRPEVFTAVGIVGVVGAGVIACKRTLELPTVIEEATERKEALHSACDQPDNQYKKELAKVKIGTAVQIAKLYAPPVTLGACSIALIVGGHRILRKENAALGAALTGLTEAFKKYRKRVIEDQGIDKDRLYRYGGSMEPVKMVNDDGEVTGEYMVHLGVDGLSQYCAEFSWGNPNFQPNQELNHMFLKMQQADANNMLHANGYLFLSDVLDMLGIERTEDSVVCGWVEGNGDGCVDFGIYDPNNPKYPIGGADCDGPIYLDFNVDGNIHAIFRKGMKNRPYMKA